MLFVFFVSFLLVTSLSINSPLNILKQCGQSQKISLSHDKVDRSVYVYFPTILCDDEKFSQFIVDNTDLTSFDPSTQTINYPILLALHYLGGQGTEQIAKFREYSESLGFIIVAPNGGTGSGSSTSTMPASNSLSNIKGSWNADYCCDPSMTKSLDDVSYIYYIIKTIIQLNIVNLFPFLRFDSEAKLLGKSDILLTGYSNGGFMSDKLAWLGASEQFPYIGAVSPISGYSYEPFKDYIKPQQQSHIPISLFLHHSLTDTTIGYNGCCSAKQGSIHGTECWKGVQKTTDCVGVKDDFRRWFDWNGCQINKIDGININNNANLRDNDDNWNIIKKENEELFDKLSIKYKMPNEHDMTCAKATIDKHGCNRLTQICLYEKSQHGSWSKLYNENNNKDGFANIGMIMEFFMQSLCEMNNGEWNNIMYNDENEELKDERKGRYHMVDVNNINLIKQCKCSKDSNKIGPFCMTSKDVFATTHEAITVPVYNDEEKDEQEDTGNDENDNKVGNVIGVDMYKNNNDMGGNNNDNMEEEEIENVDRSQLRGKRSNIVRRSNNDGDNRISNVGGVGKYKNLSPKARAQKVPVIIVNDRYSWSTIFIIFIAVFSLGIYMIWKMKCVQSKCTFRRKYQHLNNNYNDNENYDDNDNELGYNDNNNSNNKRQVRMSFKKNETNEIELNFGQNNNNNNQLRQQNGAVFTID